MRSSSGTTEVNRPVWLWAVGCAATVGIALGIQCHNYQAGEKYHTKPAVQLRILAARGDASGVRSMIETASELTPADHGVALRLAAVYGQEAVVAALLECGVDPDAKG